MQKLILFAVTFFLIKESKHVTIYTSWLYMYRDWVDMGDNSLQLDELIC